MNQRIKTLLNLGLNIRANGNLYIGNLEFTPDEIFRHPDFDTLENKISDYIEQM